MGRHAVDSKGTHALERRRIDAHVIQVRDLVYTYPDGTRALDGFSFEVGTGESLALVGANGAGKSTLLLHLNGYLTPREGSVTIDGTPVTQHALAEVRRKVGMLFQNSDDQLFMPTVLQDVAFGPLNMGLPPETAKARAGAVLERVGVSHLADRAPYHLSAGEKRAVAIATVLAMDPEIIVMDEPSSGLDPRARRRLIGLLGELDHTKVIATHDLDLALELCDRVIVLSQGRVAAEGDAGALLGDEEMLTSCGLELPLVLAAHG